MDSNPIVPNTTDPVIFVIGSTASGKTKLSLELARTRNEIEIVNADALQLYKGADIMTAKATPQERQLVQHHLLDILPLENLEFNRKDYFNLASNLITDLHKQGKIPLVVGGTNYYIESLLYTESDQVEASLKDQTELNKLHETLSKDISQTKADLLSEVVSNADQTSAAVFTEGWEALPSKKKHGLLAKVDPLIAEKVHPNDSKRVENYIRVYLEEGVIPSKKLIKLNSQRKLRYKNTVVFWVRDQHKENLLERIKKRIHEMIDINGMREVITVFSQVEKTGSLDFSKGVLQSIGYKELYDFYKKVKENAVAQNILNPAEVLEGVAKVEDLELETKKVLDECMIKLVTATEQYARKQLTWIRNRMESDSRLKGRLFVLEFSEAAKFQEEVVTKGVRVLDDFLAGRLVAQGDEEEDIQKEAVEIYKTWKRFSCEVCGKDLSGQEQWETHLASKKHQKIQSQAKKHKKKMELKMKHEQLQSQKNDNEPQDTKPEDSDQEIEDSNKDDDNDTGQEVSKPVES